MVIEKVPFQRYKLDEEKAKEKGKTISVWLNEEEYKRVQELKRVIQQPKDSTALKILAEVGANLIEHDLTGKILQIVLNNITKNKRTGYQIVE